MESTTKEADFGPFCDLLPELYYKIFDYCPGGDLKNISCCNRQFYEAVKPNLWRNVHLPGNCLDLNSLLEDEGKRMINLRYTKTLWLKDFYLHNEHQLANYNLLLERCTAVKTFVRRGSQFVDERFFANTFEKLRNLKAVCISDVARGSELPARTFLCLTKLRNVTHLSLSYTLVDDSILKMLCDNFSSLVSLDLSGTRVTASGLAGLTNFTNLRALGLRGTRIYNLGTSCIGLCRSLRRLDIARCSISNGDLHDLANLTELTWLDLSHNDMLSYTCIAQQIGSFRKMQKLFLNGIRAPTIIDALSLIDLCVLECLTCLEVNHAYLNDDCLRSFCQLRSLVRLDLYGCKGFTDDGLMSLGFLSELEELAISGHYTDVGLTCISELPMLRQLILNVTHCCQLEGITDEGLAHLQNLERLKDLKIFAHNITDVGFANISRILSLQRLDVSEMEMTSSAFEHLSRLPHLKWFRCENCSSPRPPGVPPTEIPVSRMAVDHGTGCPSYCVTQQEQAHLMAMLNENEENLPLPGPQGDADDPLNQQANAEDPLEQQVHAAEAAAAEEDPIGQHVDAGDPLDQVPDSGQRDFDSFIFGPPRTNHQPTNETMFHISKMSSLEMLDITGASRVTDECLDSLMQLSCLKTLVCLDTGLTSSGLGQLSQVKNVVKSNEESGGSRFRGGWQNYKYRTISVFR